MTVINALVQVNLAFTHLAFTHLAFTHLAFTHLACTHLDKIAGVVAIASLITTGFSTGATLRFFRSSASLDESQDPRADATALKISYTTNKLDDSTDSTAAMISVLKPIRAPAQNPQAFCTALARNLESFLDLEGPYELLLAIADPRDPALLTAQAFLQAAQKTRPTLPIRLVIGTPESSLPRPNLKMLNLMALDPYIQGDILLISDDATVAHGGDLAAIATAFADPQVGWASAPFFVRRPISLGAQLRSLFIGGQLSKISVALYRYSGMVPTMGKWMAVRRSALEGIGGFAELAKYLGEDGILEPLLRPQGWQGRLLPTLIDLNLGPWTLAQAWAQPVRWARLIRFFYPSGPLLLLLFNGSFWLLLALGVVGIGYWDPHKTHLGAGGLALAGLSCWLSNALIYTHLGGDLQAMRWQWLCDFQLMGAMLVSLWGNQILWRGQHYRITRRTEIL
jgi:ceramide glucosyltransferase